MSILSRVPGYETAGSISSVDAKDLTPESFAREYIGRMRPCVVRGAARHWPAMERWGSLEYVVEKVGNPTVRVATQPLIEPSDDPRNKAAVQEMPLERYLSELTSGARGHFVLHSYDLRGKGRLAPLGDDVLGFPFVPAPQEPLFYAPKRAFMYRDSYTDWHHHPTDETLMTQVKGAKEVLLLPPDASTYRLLSRIGKTAMKLWDVDEQAFPEWQRVTPYRVLVDEGDALYIPTYWWHAVESVGAPFGWTVAWCWRSPIDLFDPRLLGVRQTLKRVFFSRQMPLAIAAATWSLVRRFGQPVFSV